MSCAQGCNSGCGICTESCECQRCSGTSADQLAPPSNRPGLTALATRIGDYRTFFDDAIRRLTSHEAPLLQALGTRDPSDATIALLDAWSVVADVLTFYRERLTNEGYLRTATDERSLRELASLVGFKPRPGVAATVHLAYLLDPSAAPVDIPIGAKAQTVPLPGEKMQTFETDEVLSARAEWSEMKPRQTRPPLIDRVNALMRPTIRLTDTTLVVRPGERVLFVFGMQPGQQVVREVLSSKLNIEQGYVELTLKPRAGFSNKLAEKLVNLTDKIQATLPAAGNDDTTAKLRELLAVVTSSLLGNDSARDAKEHCDQLAHTGDEIVRQFAEACSDIFEKIAGSKLPATKTLEATSLDDVLVRLQAAPARQLNSGKFLSQEAKDGLGSKGDKRFGLMQSITPILQDTLYQALDALPANAVPATAPSVYLLRTVSSPFGAVAPPKMSGAGDRFRLTEWLLEDIDKGTAFLETVADTITADSFAIVDTPWFVTVARDDVTTISPDRLVRFARVRSSQTVPRGNYTVNGKVTRLDLVEPDTGDELPVVVK